MPHWILKAAIQGALSRLPEPQRWNRFFQKHVTRSLDLREAYFLEKWRQCERHARNLARHLGEDRPTFSAIELGTGWFPVTPIGLALCGGHTVRTIDMQDLLTHDAVVETLRFYRAMAEAGRIDLVGVDAQDKLACALEAAPHSSARELLAVLGVESIVGDARATSLDRGCADLVCSNNTLEHIPRDVLVDIFRELGRLVSERGLMSHHIDLADHYASFDPNITVYNFLRFSRRTWSLFNNDLQWQNRLRISDYRAIHGESGWTILEEDSTRQPIEVLRSVPLADEFEFYSEEDLGVCSTWLTSVR